MFSHIYVGVSDFRRAHAFYGPLMAELGLRQRFFDPNRSWAAWQLVTGARPLFIIGLPFNGAPHEAGDGQMAAFLAKGRSTVDRVYPIHRSRRAWPATLQSSQSPAPGWSFLASRLSSSLNSLQPTCCGWLRKPVQAAVLER
jgi:hypothetical protein